MQSGRAVKPCRSPHNQLPDPQLRLVRVAAAVRRRLVGWMRSGAVALRGMGRSMRSAGVRRSCVGWMRSAVRSAGMGIVAVGWMRGAVRSRATGKTAVIGRIAAITVVAASACSDEAMMTPAMGVAPASPWAHAQENAVVEVSWAVEANRRAGVRRVVVVAVGTDGWNADVNDDLPLSDRRDRRHSQAREQRRSAEQSFNSTHISGPSFRDGRECRVMRCAVGFRETRRRQPT